MRHSAVYFAQDDAAIENFSVNAGVVGRMVDALVVATTGKPDVASAWKSLVKPGDRVGIKVSAGGGRYFSTHQPLVDAIVNGLERAGISRGSIIIWDRADMTTYRTGAAGCQVRSIGLPSDYDQAAVFSSPLTGRLIWGDLLFSKKENDFRNKQISEQEQLSVESHWSKIVSKGVTKIINVPVMGSSENCGIAGCLYNATIPNVDNWRRFTSSPRSSDPYICELYADGQIKPKVVLNIMDGLIAQYAGGAGFEPGYAFHHRTIYAGRDPVAVDATALREIEKWRAQAGLRPIGERAAYLQSAEAMGIGNFSPDRIELNKVTAPR